MNAELPPFKNGKHNSESGFTLDRDITPLMVLYETMCISGHLAIRLAEVTSTSIGRASVSWQ